MNKEDYGVQYKEHFLDQYRLFVEMADNVSNRRSSANNFFIAAHTLLIGIITVFKPAESIHPIIVLALGLFGTILCYVWWITLNAYRQLNNGKFKVIQEMEAEMPFSMFKREWDILENGESRDKYKQVSKIEKLVPLFFLLPYVLIIVYGISSLVSRYLDISSQTAYL